MSGKWTSWRAQFIPHWKLLGPGRGFRLACISLYLLVGSRHISSLILWVQLELAWISTFYSFHSFDRWPWSRIAFFLVKVKLQYPVKKIVKILKAKESSYHPPSKDIFKEIEDGKGRVNEMYIFSVFICVCYRIIYTFSWSNSISHDGEIYQGCRGIHMLNQAPLCAELTHYSFGVFFKLYVDAFPVIKIDERYKSSKIN